MASSREAMDPFFVATALKYYKRRDVQEAIAKHAKDREVSPRYGEGFGRRPDVIEHPGDVIEFAKRKTTSFHCSEERWEQPLQIVTGSTRKELDALRTGWDLVLDIDTKDWELSRLTAWLFVAALRAHKIKGVTAKFSGNKGWHIGVAWESFARTMTADSGEDLHMKDLFPEMPRAIARYLVEYINNPDNGLVKVDGNDVIFAIKGRTLRKELAALATQAGKSRDDILLTWCTACRKPVQRADEQWGLTCRCGFRPTDRYTPEQKTDADDRVRICPKCKGMMEFYLASRGAECTHSVQAYQQRLDITKVVEFDTILLASRHLYRMPYSLHEKSGLASVVIDPDRILTFKKEQARPETIAFDRMFLDPALAVPGEASKLAGLSWESVKVESRPRQTEFDVPEDAIPEEHFPPCMRKILDGMEDGKKRALFALVNFLQTAGWPPEMIEERIAKWNEKNPEPLREVVIKGHLRQHLGKSLKILPPNCMQFYRELGVCQPDDLCRAIKNPAMYAARKAKKR